MPKWIQRWVVNGDKKRLMSRRTLHAFAASKGFEPDDDIVQTGDIIRFLRDNGFTVDYVVRLLSPYGKDDEYL